MASIEISEMGFDDLMGWFVRPALPLDEDYEDIWRAAASVRWDAKSRCLYVMHVHNFEAIDYLRQIVSVVDSEYGDHLFVTDNTILTRIPQELVSKIRTEFRHM